MNTVLVAALLGGLVDPSESEGHGFTRHFDLARRPEFRCVGFFRVGPVGSGVWIYDDYVLTLGEAAFENDGRMREPGDCEFVLTDTAGAEHAYRGRAWVVPNVLRETLGQKTLTGNLAVLRLDRKVRVPGSGPAILGFARPVAGEALTCVGFGQRGLLGQAPDPQKYGAGSTDEPSQALAFNTQVRGDTMPETLDSAPGPNQPMAGASATGDEGGGVFGYQRGEWRLVGLLGKPRPDHARTTIVTVSAMARPILKGVVQGQWSDFLGVSGQQPGSP